MRNRARHDELTSTGEVRKSGEQKTTDPYRHADGRGEPDDRGRGQTVDVVAQPQDRTCAQEPDPGDDLSGDSCWVYACLERREQANPCEQTCAYRDERHRFQTSRVASILSLDSEDQAQEERYENAKT